MAEQTRPCLNSVSAATESLEEEAAAGDEEGEDRGEDLGGKIVYGLIRIINTY